MNGSQRDVANPKLSRISMAADGSVWGLDADGALMGCTEDVTAWQERPGPQLVSVGAGSDGTVYAVGEDGGFYAYSGGWVSLGELADGRLASVSVGGADAVWGVDTGGRVLRYDAAGGGWHVVDAPPDGPVARVSATLDGSVFCLTTKGIVHSWQSTGWQPLLGGQQFTAIGAGEAGWVWAVTADGAPAQYDGHSWQPVTGPGSPLARIAAGADLTVWSLDTAGRLFQFEPARHSWRPVPSPVAVGHIAVSDIALGTIGSAWVVGTGRVAYEYTWDASLWSPAGAPGTYAQIAAVSAHDVWAVDASGQVVELTAADDGSWSRAARPGGPGWLSAGRDGSVWGVRADGTIASYDPAGNGWKPLAGQPAPAVRVSAVSASCVTALDKSGAVYQYLYNASDETQTWTKLDQQAPAGGLADIGTLGEGVVYAAAVTGDVYLYIAGNWLGCAGKITAIAVGGVTDVWAIDADGHPVRLVRGLMEGGTESGPGLPGWDAEDVFDDLRSTHLWIVNRAIERAAAEGGPVGAWLAKVLQPGQGKTGQPLHDQMCQGVYDADFVPPYNNPVPVYFPFPFPGVEIPTYASHFYDPVTGRNWLGSSDVTALKWGSSFFRDSVGAYLNGNEKEAGYRLGLALHYMTDVTQPMHAHNYTVLNSFRPGYHTDFESYIMGYQSSADFKPEVRAIPTLGGAPEAYIHAGAEFSRPYLDKLISWLPGIYIYFSETYASLARETAPALLGNAIAVTAGFLLAWAYQAYRRPEDWEDRGLPSAQGTQARAITGLGATLYDGSPHMFVTGDDGNLWECWFNGAGWSWGSHARPAVATLGAPIGATTARTGPALFLLDGDGQALVRWWRPDPNSPDSNVWEWRALGAPPDGTRITGGAAVASDATDAAVYVCTGGGALYKNQVPDNQWEWVDRPEGQIVTAVLGGAVIDGTRCVIVNTVNGQLYLFRERSYSKGDWHPVGAPAGLKVASGLGVAPLIGCVLCTDGAPWVYTWQPDVGGTNWYQFGEPQDDLTIASGLTLNDAAFPYFLPKLMGVTREGPLVIGTWAQHISWDDRGEPGKTSIASPVGYLPFQGGFLTAVVGADGHLWV